MFIFNEAVNNQEVKDIRNALQLTQKAFAELVGVSVKTVVSWEIAKSQ